MIMWASTQSDETFVLEREYCSLHMLIISTLCQTWITVKYFFIYIHLFPFTDFSIQHVHIFFKLIIWLVDLTYYKFTLYMIVSIKYVTNTIKKKFLNILLE